MSLEKRLFQLKQRIAEAAQVADRESSQVRLIAVSKTHSVQKILAAYQEGQRLFGENYVQEFVEKSHQLPAQKIEWHFIGRLQSNKVKPIVGKVQLIHSVDRLSLASEISRRAVEAKVTQDILLQINIGQEATKGGVGLPGLRGLATAVCQLSNLRVMGLMSMPPLETAARDSQEYFQQTREALEDLRGYLPHETLKSHPFCDLSMGTSGDFIEAIREGATYIRIGTEIFGPREE